jgi:phosphoribosylamine--glycine ligase
VTAIGKDLREAVARAYQGVNRIQWDGCYYRRDIAAKALRRGAAAGRPPVVGIVMGSDSDLSVMKSAAELLRSMDIPYEITVVSAHRSPERAANYAITARQRGLRLIIAGAGMAAHLAGVMAAHTDLPVIGVPLDSSALNGLDALLSTVQMPSGVPVATMGIGKAGAWNAAVLALRILALTDSQLQEKHKQFREDMAKEVEEKAKRLHD